MTANAGLGCRVRKVCYDETYALRARHIPVFKPLLNVHYTDLRIEICFYVDRDWHGEKLPIDPASDLFLLGYCELTREVEVLSAAPLWETVPFENGSAKRGLTDPKVNQ